MASIPLAGSERTLLAGAQVVGRVPRAKRIRLTLHVRPATESQGSTLSSFVSRVVSQSVGQRNHLTRAEYAKQFGASSADFGRIKSFAREYGLRVVPDGSLHDSSSVRSARRTVDVEGSVGAIGKAFGVELIHARDSAGRLYRTYQGAIQIPQEYQDVVRNVFGLDTRPQVAPRLRFLRSAAGYARGAQGTNIIK